MLICTLVKQLKTKRKDKSLTLKRTLKFQRIKTYHFPK